MSYVFAIVMLGALFLDLAGELPCSPSVAFGFAVLSAFAWGAL